MANFNPIESILPVCDKPYHKIKENVPLGEELANLLNYPLYVRLLVVKLAVLPLGNIPALENQSTH